MSLAINQGRMSEDIGSERNAWTIALACWLGALLMVTALFYETALSMVQIWINSATFGHGFLIPIISAALIWRDRDTLAALQPKPALIALIPLAALSIGWFVARLVDISLVEQLAYVGILQCVTLAILGWRVVRAMLFPLGFLIFMVPFGEFLVPPLQVYTTDFIVWWLRLLDIPVFREGIFLHLPGGSFEVAEACAGLRFLIATIVLGVLFAYMFFQDWRRRLLFVGLSLLVPIIANGFRALMIVLIAYWTDHEVAVGVDHLVFGWVFLTMVLVLLLGFGLLLRPRLAQDSQGPSEASGGDDVPPPPRNGRTAPSRLLVIGVTLAAILVPATGPAFAAWRSQDAPDTSGLALNLPAGFADWRRVADPADDWRPTFSAAHATAMARYREEGEETEPVDIFVAWYAHQRQDAELVNSQNRLVPVAPDDPGADSAWSQVRTVRIGGAEAAGPALQASEIRRRGGARRLVVPLYWVDGELTQSGVVAKLLQLRSVLTVRSEAAAGIVLSVPLRENGPRDHRALLAAIEDLPALTEGLLPQTAR